MINVIHKDHPGGTDSERELGGYVWNRANNWTVEMLDSHAEILKGTPEADEFSFEPLDPNAPANAHAEARTQFATLKPGKEVAAAAPAASATPPAAWGSSTAVNEEGHTNA